MTLHQWCVETNVQAFQHESGAYYIPDRNFNGKRSLLFQLDDFIVSSVIDGTIWLIHKWGDSDKMFPNTPNDIRLALYQHRQINDCGRQWAKLEILQFAYERAVRLNVGNIWSDGRKEIALYTRTFHLNKNGTVSTMDHVHP